MSAIQNETLDGVFAVLRQHRCIGWDLDNTLLGHRASDKLHDFIRASPDIRHLLITFRTAQGTIWTDLASQQRAVSADSFSVVETMDPVLATNFMRLQRQRAQGLYAGPMAFCELEYRSWKGRVCARHGASLLIDDMTDYVSLGCERHAISLLHPDQLV
jgi:hypothetical protein